MCKGNKVVSPYLSTGYARGRRGGATMQILKMAIVVTPNSITPPFQPLSNILMIDNKHIWPFGNKGTVTKLVDFMKKY